MMIMMCMACRWLCMVGCLLGTGVMAFSNHPTSSVSSSSMRNLWWWTNHNNHHDHHRRHHPHYDKIMISKSVSYHYHNIRSSSSSSSSSTALYLFPNWRKKKVTEDTTSSSTSLTEENVMGNVRQATTDETISTLVTPVDATLAVATDDSNLAASWSSTPTNDNNKDMILGTLTTTTTTTASTSSSSQQQQILQVGTASLLSIIVVALCSQSPFLYDHANIVIVSIFVLGYLGIIFEQVLEINKAAVALLMSTGLWVTYADYYYHNNNNIENPVIIEGMGGDSTSSNMVVLSQLSHQLAEVSDICFFLLAASAIVEVVDAHEGFRVVTNQIRTTSKQQLFWTIGFLTFFLSSILNNLTVTIVMCSLLRKLVPNVEDRKLFGAMVVVAANAGGVWTPIGDVTTTMLWINHQLSTVPTILELFIPSVVCLIGSMIFLVKQVEEEEPKEEPNILNTTPSSQFLTPDAAASSSEITTEQIVVFSTGIASLLSVPIFAELTGLPPYLAMLTGLGVIWTLTDLLHFGNHHLDETETMKKMPASLAKVDTSGILFFLGILMSIGVLDQSGLLKQLAMFLSDTLPSLDIIATVIGLASALIDNVPLVAATMGMYDIQEYGTDDRLWQLIALCAGTGGSILVIGSASGVALMSLEKVDFLWYLKKVSLGATIGYFCGIAAYLVQNAILSGNLFTAQTIASSSPAMEAMQQVGSSVVMSGIL